jgi:ABC-type sugar transport system permease subunit
MAAATLFYAVPNAFNFYYAFTDWSTYKDKISWVGWQNFSDLWSEGTLRHSVVITAVFAVTVMIAQNLMGLALAAALQERTRFNVVMRAVFFIPVLISPLAAGYIFRALLDPNGALNSALSRVVGHGVHFPWLGSTSLSLFVAAFITSWKWYGLLMTIYIAGLNSVPQELLEAARVDGVSRAQIFRRIKLPLIGPAITFNVAATLIGALSTFDVIIGTTGGGPGNATEVMNMFVFTTYGTGRFAQGTAASLVLFLLVCVCAVPTVGYLRRREVEL